jgi:hypothetical protein
MRMNRKRRAAGAATTLLLGMAAGPPASAAAIEQRLFFAATGQNPFQAGPAISGAQSWGISAPISRREVPALRFPPSGPLYLEAGGRTEGVLGLNLHTAYSTGTLDLSYPMRASIAAPDANQVRLGDSFRLALAGNAPASGVFRFSDVVSTTRAVDLGGGVRITGGSASTELVRPAIRTTFPSLSARLDLSYEQRNAAYLQGCADALIARACADIGKVDLPSLGPVTQTIASLGPQGAYVLPGTSFEVGVGFGTPIPLAFGVNGEPSVTVTPFYPNLATTGAMAGDNGPLQSSGSQPLIRLQARLDSLIDDYVLRPALLPTLTGSIGPGTYTLLEATGTLDATVYQEFSYDPALRVRLDFDQPMRLANGVVPFTSVEVAAGEALDLRAVNLRAEEVTVQPTYLLGGTLDSETGLGIGAGIDVKALRFQIAGLDTGFAFEGGLYDDVPILPLVTAAFTPTVPGIAGAPFTLDFANRFAVSEVVADRIEAGGIGRATIQLGEFFDDVDAEIARNGRFFGADGRPILAATAEGFISYDGRAFERPGQNIFFLADSDVTYDSPYDQPGLPADDLGRLFCFACLSGMLPGTEAPTVFTLADGSQVLVNAPAAAVEQASPGPSRSGGTELLFADAGGFTRYTPGDVPSQFAWLFDSATVPEPGALKLFGGALFLLGVALRRRAARH